MRVDSLEQALLEKKSIEQKIDTLNEKIVRLESQRLEAKIEILADKVHAIITDLTTVSTSLEKLEEDVSGMGQYVLEHNHKK